MRLAARPLGPAMRSVETSPFAHVTFLLLVRFWLSRLRQSQAKPSQRFLIFYLVRTATPIAVCLIAFRRPPIREFAARICIGDEDRTLTVSLASLLDNHW